MWGEGEDRLFGTMAVGSGFDPSGGTCTSSVLVGGRPPDITEALPTLEAAVNFCELNISLCKGALSVRILVVL